MAPPLIGGVVRAAGGVLWRRPDTAADTGSDRGDVEVALVHRPRYDDWSLPKGKLDADEHPLAGACREIVEETGTRPVVGPYLGVASYRVRTKSGTAPKLVEYWAMRAGSASQFQPNSEVDAVSWLAPAQARERLEYPHDRQVLATFTELPEITGTVLLIRHGQAGERSEWTGDDRLRPLTTQGRLEAEWMARTLPWFAPTRLISADRVRCTQTLEPLAPVLGVGIEIDPILSEHRHADAPDAAPACVRELAARGEVVAVCSQGEVIPDVVSALAAAGGLRLGPVTSPKGSVWALFFHGPTLVWADHLPDLSPAGAVISANR